MKLLSFSRKLSQRERYAVYGAATVIGLILVHMVVINPIADARDRLSRERTAKMRMAEEMLLLQADYRETERRNRVSVSRYSGRKAGFTLFSFLDRLAGEAGMKDDITYMKPSTVTPKNSAYKIAKVEMKFENITMEQLSTYLYKVETSRNLVWVKRLSVSKDAKQAGSISAILQVETTEA